jgi:hypothetical protein
MKDMQLLIDDAQVIPNIVKVTATYVEPDTGERIGATVEIVMHLCTKNLGIDGSDATTRTCSPLDTRFYKQLSKEAINEAERILRQILEVD